MIRASAPRASQRLYDLFEGLLPLGGMEGFYLREV